MIARRCVAAAAAVGLGALGCGGSEGRAVGPLTWAKDPMVFQQGSAPDRVLRGRVRNDGLRPLTLLAKDIRLLDGDGSPVPGVATFAAGYLHSLYPPTREPVLPEREERRLGRRLILRPQQTAMLTVAWRERPGRPPPVSISYNGGRLPIEPAR